MPRVALHTLGCKLNYAETSAIGKQFLDRGYEIVDLGEPADVCVINTCSVTARANRECRQVIRRALRTADNPVVVVTGCYAQLEPEEVASIDGVDLVLGSREKSKIFRSHRQLREGACSPRHCLGHLRRGRFRACVVDRSRQPDTRVSEDPGRVRLHTAASARFRSHAGTAEACRLSLGRCPGGGACAAGVPGNCPDRGERRGLRAEDRFTPPGSPARAQRGRRARPDPDQLDRAQSPYR